MQSSSGLVSISIDELRVGMHIVKLDISWLDSPFLSHSRLIGDPQDIHELRSSGVQTLTIDLRRGIGPQVVEAPAGFPTVETSSEPFQVQPVPVSLERELEVATQLRHKVRKAVDRVQQALESGAPVDTDALLPLVDSTLDSLMRNDQALMSLVHLSRRTQRLADHVFGTFCLVLNLALVRQIPVQEREQLGLAALLHEAGWVQLPLNLLGKRTSYSKSELALVQHHTLIGDKILAAQALPELVLRIVSEHHELADGSGYPRGLMHTELHPLSQLLGLVDAYEERVHHLLDQPAMIPTLALRSLYRDAERGAYCPELVAALIGMLGIYPPCTAIALNSGEKALVRICNKEAPLRPVIRIFYDAHGRMLPSPLDIDLNDPVAGAGRTIEQAIDPSAPGVDPGQCLRAESDR